MIGVFSGVGGQAQDFLISRFETDRSGRHIIRHASDPAFYYILYQGESPTRIVSAVDMALGVPVEGQLSESAGAPLASFFRVRQLPVAQPLDTDGDGIDDVWELRRPVLNPLLASDAQLPSGGPGSSSWRQVYESEKAEGERIVAGFVEEASAHLTTEGTVQLRVRFSRSYSGPLRFQAGGTAVAERDYQIAGLNSASLAGQIDVNGNEATILVALVNPVSLERAKTLLLTLVEPGGSGGYRVTPGVAGMHSMSVRSASRGLFAGTIVFTNGVFIGAQKVRMALRDTADRRTEAFFDSQDSSVLNANFAVPVTIGGESGTMLFTETISRTVESPTLGRSITWTLRIAPAAVNGGLVNASVRLELGGLTAAGFKLDAVGTMLLSRLDPLD